MTGVGVILTVAVKTPLVFMLMLFTVHKIVYQIVFIKLLAPLHKMQRHCDTDSDF